MSDGYYWSFKFSGRDLPEGCDPAFESAGAGILLPAEDLGCFPAVLAQDESFQHMLSVGDWRFVEEGNGAFQLSFGVANLHESTTWPMQSLLLPWLCQFAAVDQTVGTVAREPERRDKTLIYAVDGSAVFVSVDSAGGPDLTDLDTHSLRSALRGNLVDGKGDLEWNKQTFEIMAVHWSAIAGNLR